MAAETSDKFSLSLIGDEFSPDELGKIYGIQAKNREMTLSSESLEDCAEVLRNHKDKPKDGDISDDELINMFQAKKH